MRLTLDPAAFIHSNLPDVACAPALPRPVKPTAARKPRGASNPRLKAELCIFSILLFLNVVKYVVLGSALGCG
jgi:hypothetical protein